MGRPADGADIDAALECVMPGPRIIQRKIPTNEKSPLSHFNRHLPQATENMHGVVNILLDVTSRSCAVKTVFGETREQNPLDGPKWDWAKRICVHPRARQVQTCAGIPDPFLGSLNELEYALAQLEFRTRLNRRKDLPPFGVRHKRSARRAAHTTPLPIKLGAIMNSHTDKATSTFGVRQ